MANARTNGKAPAKKSVGKTNKIPTTRNGTVKVDYLRMVHKARSPRAQAQDNRKDATRIYPRTMTPEQAEIWLYNPGRYDISGIDTDKEPNVEFKKRTATAEPKTATAKTTKPKTAGTKPRTATTKKPVPKKKTTTAKKPVVERSADEPGGWVVKKKPRTRWGKKGSLENTDRYRALERAYQMAEESGDEEEMYRAASDMYSLEQMEKDTHEVDLPEMIAYLEDCGFDDEVYGTADVNWRKKPWVIREEYVRHKAADARMSEIDMDMAMGMSYNRKSRRRFWKRR